MWYTDRELTRLYIVKSKRTLDTVPTRPTNVANLLKDETLVWPI